MTQRDLTGANAYQPPSTGSTNDVFNLLTPRTPYTSGFARRPARYSISKLDKEGNYYYWRIELISTLGGLNAQRGLFPEVHDKLAVSSMDSRFPDQLIQPQLETISTTPDPTSPTVLAWTHAFNTFVMGSGTGANTSLFFETSATNPVPSAFTYTPLGAILCLVPVVLNTAVPYLMVGTTGGANFRTDLANPPGGSANGTGNLANPTYGAIQTTINDNAVLFLTAVSGTGAGLSYLAGTSTVVTAPTLASTRQMPKGGYAVGLISLGGPARCYWFQPRVSYVNSALGTAGDIISTNQNGADWQPLVITALPYVLYAFPFRGGIAATDGRDWVHISANGEKRLYEFRDRYANSNISYRIRGGTANGPELISEVQEIASAGSTTVTNRYLEAYNYELDAWHTISAKTNLSTTGLLGTPAAGALPLSQTTGYVSTYTDGSWYQLNLPPYGYNPYPDRKTSGATAGTGRTFATGGQVYWPAFQIPGLEGWPLAVRRISGNPQIEIGGGTPSSYPTVNILVGGMSATFVYGYDQGRQEFTFWDNENVVYELQPILNINQQVGGTDPTRTTLQALPIVIEGIARRPEFQMGAEIADFTR